MLTPKEFVEKLAFADGKSVGNAAKTVSQAAQPKTKTRQATSSPGLGQLMGKATKSTGATAGVGAPPLGPATAQPSRGRELQEFFKNPPREDPVGIARPYRESFSEEGQDFLRSQGASPAPRVTYPSVPFRQVKERPDAFDQKLTIPQEGMQFLHSQGAIPPAKAKRSPERWRRYLGIPPGNLNEKLHWPAKAQPSPTRANERAKELFDAAPALDLSDPRTFGKAAALGCKPIDHSRGKTKKLEKRAIGYGTLIGGAGGAVGAPSGHRLEGGGRGAARGLGWDAGGGVGSLLGALGGGGLGTVGGGGLGALLAALSGNDIGMGAAAGAGTGGGLGALTGGIGGYLGGGYLGQKGMKNLRKPPSWEKKDPEGESKTESKPESKPESKSEETGAKDEQSAPTEERKEQEA